MQEVRQARSETKQLVEDYVKSISINDYTQEKYNEFTTVLEKYSALIDNSISVIEINELGLLAISEMNKIESKFSILLKQTKEQARQQLLSYKKRDDYLTDDWFILQTIIESACIKIDKAITQEEVTKIVTNAKMSIDKIPTYSG